jgi:hypothetical protein
MYVCCEMSFVELDEEFICAWNNMENILFKQLLNKINVFFLNVHVFFDNKILF